MILENNDLVEILKERKQIQDDIEVIIKKMQDLDAKRLKLGYKMDKLKEKTRVIIEENPQELNDFDFISSVELKDGEANLVISNLVEDNYKTKEQITAEIIRQAQTREGIFRESKFIEQVKFPAGTFDIVLPEPENPEPLVIS